MSRLAILAFGGGLPGRLASAHPDALFVTFGADTAPPPSGVAVAPASYERWGAMFRTLRDADVTDIVMAGSLARPKLRPARFDAKTLALAPKLMVALKGGDDQLLRTVISLFEREGFVVRGAHELMEGLTAPAGVLCGRKPTAPEREDIALGASILAALGPLDVGQGTVVAGGLCLGIETVQGTDAMLQFAGATPDRLRRAPGVLVKAPKPGQDLRVDMPSIGPATVAASAAAGLAGIVIAADRVLVLELDETLQAARTAGLFIVAQAV